MLVVVLVVVMLIVVVLVAVVNVDSSEQITYLKSLLDQQQAQAAQEIQQQAQDNHTNGTVISPTQLGEHNRPSINWETVVVILCHI